MIGIWRSNAHNLALDSCSYKSVASILKTKLDQQPLPPHQGLPPPAVPDHDNLRGAAYYQPPSPYSREECDDGIPADHG